VPTSTLYFFIIITHYNTITYNKNGGGIEFICICKIFFVPLHPQKQTKNIKTLTNMKAIKAILFCLVAVLFASCAGVNTTPYTHNMPETKVILKEANYKIVGQVEGEWSATYVFGIGGFTKKSLKNNAISEMYKNANLTGTQQIINITTTTSVANYLLYTKTRAVARGYIIEFVE
jgi:hypothetical protein